MNQTPDDLVQNKLIGLPASDEEEPVAWLQISLCSTPKQQTAVEQCLESAGALSIMLSDGEDTPIFEPLPGETPLWPSLRISGLFELPTQVRRQKRKLNKLLGQIRRQLGDVELVSSIFEDEEWVRTCLHDFVPIDVGHGMWIVPSWHETPPQALTALRLDPGLAFGTGTHATTFLCLAWLAQHSKDIPLSRVIDYGCGSGILGIGAALLGASEVLGTDIDGQALLATQMNAEKNQVEHKITLVKPSKLHSDDTYTQYFDIVLANILAEPLMGLSEQLASLVKPGGSICLSGLLERHEQSIINAYSHSFEQFNVEILDGWARITAIRKN